MAPKKKVKSEAPVWEFLKDGTWTAYADEDAALLEKAYNSDSADGKFLTGDLSFNKGYSTKYLFDFKAMTQTNQDSKTVRQLRRIGTTADVMWEWIDDAGLFVPFFEVDNAEIERLYLAAGLGGTATTKNLSFNAGYDSPYLFSFEKKDADGTTVVGTQKNKESGKVRSIRRLNKKPAPWETKGYGISGAKVPIATEETTATTTATKAGGGGGGASATAAAAELTRSSTLSIPSHWTKTKGGFEKIGGYELVDVDPKSEEFGVMAAAVSSTITKKKVKVTKVTRIENAALWAFYAMTRAHIAKRNKGDANERLLFYGERSAPNMETIIKLGFDVRVAQSGNFGQGLYFGVNASYCDAGLVKENKDGSKEVFVCNVAIGETAKGEKNLRRPPPKDPKLPSGDIFDSCVDDPKNPSLYILFNQSQAYPSYIVRYE